MPSILILPAGWDFVITAFVLSAGTEGINSIVKFLKYSKEDKKATAASKDPSGPAAAALVRMDRA